MRRIMIAGTHSGCGKTTMTCAVLQALVNRKMKVTAFKCGPDYIDPMFHSKIIGAKSRNLDSFFCDKNTLNYLLQKNGADSDISVIEGIMGFYDGVGETATSYSISIDTDTPVIIAIDCKGMSGSIGAVMSGFLNYRVPNKIVGFIFNRLSPSLVNEVKQLCDTLKTEFLGYFPTVKDSTIESRHLGLVTADEVSDIKNKLDKLAAQCEKTVCLDRIIELSECGVMSGISPPEIHKSVCEKPPRIAVAYDRAFCFYYEDNLDLLREMGCEIVQFSPLNDKIIPENISGLILGGGYPELYALRLSENKTMLESVKSAVEKDLPTIAECGGFMYLHKTMEDVNGEVFSMANVLDGHVFKTEKLQRFGYITLTASEDNLLCKSGESFPAHEFHYWDSTLCGDGFIAEKANKSAEWSCINITENLFAGFPHLHFYADIRLAESFVEKCTRYQNEQDK